MRTKILTAMRAMLVTGALTAMACSCTAKGGDVTIKFEPGIGGDTYTVEYGYVSDFVKPRAQQPQPQGGEYTLTDGKITIPTLPDGTGQYMVRVSDSEYIVIYTEPGENIEVDVTGISPLQYTATGSEMMTDIATMDSSAGKILYDYRAAMSAGTADASTLEDAENRYNAVFDSYVAAKPTSKAAPYAVMHLEGERFMEGYNKIKVADNNPLLPLLEAQKAYVERELEAQRRQVQLESGTVTAPDFTLADVTGKMVSLSDFRGKWVVIDFWGSWCPWCIKGFPKLKEAYKQYAGKMEVVGVDCRDPKDSWLLAIKKYELPWINLYNPDENGGKILEEYAVQGFPTKVIVDPQGKIRNITAGENPAFFEVLGSLIDGQ